jgi:hypothetical protein
VGWYGIILLAATVAPMPALVAAQNPIKSPPPSLVVTPSTIMTFSGPPGGPFSPSVFRYQVSASSGTIRYVIGTPAWLSASPPSGMTDTNGVTITLTVNESASRLPKGIYGPGVGFTNVTNGRGSTTKRAALIIQEPSAPVSPLVGHTPESRGALLAVTPQPPPSTSPTILSLIVTPIERVMFFGPEGGPIYPTFFQFRVSTTIGTISYTIATPSWLSAPVNFGTTDPTGRTVTVLVNDTARRFQPGDYGQDIAFTNVTNGKDRVVRPTVLTITARPQP